MLAVNEAGTSDKASKLVMEDDKSGVSVTALVSCDSDSIAELPTKDGMAEDASSTTELVSRKLVSGRSGAGVIKPRDSDVVLDGMSFIESGIEAVLSVASMFVDAETGISDQASELIVIDSNEVTSATSLVGRGLMSKTELFVIAEETSGTIKVVDDDPATPATSLVGKDPRSVVELSTYAMAEEVSCKTDVADSDPAESKISLVGRDPRSILELSAIDAIVE